jgi:hypothetical protein
MHSIQRVPAAVGVVTKSILEILLLATTPTAGGFKTLLTGFPLSRE